MRTGIIFLPTLLLIAQAAYAGPYYNPPDQASEEVKAATDEFSSLLNDARRAVIDMFDSWESDPEFAEESREKAADILAQAEEAIAVAIEDESLGGDVSYDVTGEARESATVSVRSISQEIGLELPETQGDLFRLSLAVITAYRQTLEEIEISEFPEAWEQSRQALLADVQAVLLGSAVSALSQSTN